MEKFTQGFLLLCGLSFLLIGANTFYDPLAAMAPVELNINTVSALNELRANYGGLQIGMGLFLLAGLCCKTYLRPALLAQALIVGGLVTGRLISVAIDGQPNAFIQGLIVLESITTLLSWVLFNRLSKAA
ncbi:DUF4345 domain-containing protein [Perlucidibaca aquatica]|uniref:DUF4345 domain-containing protein n=1 Tax=Perlucidibaca aquatica TaxID=1852776 RepID=UPI00083A8BF5|nr:DUF4345 domain-containing protein [Perlucidibaca aquatica]